MPIILTSDRHADPEQYVTIGLVNNMPDEALKATERQFISLLNEAAKEIPVKLSLYTLPGVPRNEASLRHMSGRYSNIDELWKLQLDGLIVTGREPVANSFVDEPYWESFARLVDWAQKRTRSTIWSCLAAHAAVFHLDGIERVRRNEKLFGVFDCTRVSNHPLTATTSPLFRTPHSRWNGLAQRDLIDAGYNLLTLCSDTGVDSFAKQFESLFVFFQGHPEYEADTLLREYRRDIARYYKGEASLYPSLPREYFDNKTLAALSAFPLENKKINDHQSLTAIAAVLGDAGAENTWKSSATSVYENWVRHIGVKKPVAVWPESRKSIVKAHTVRNYDPAFTEA